MSFSVLTPRKALNKSYLKVKPQREDIERFKSNLIELLDQINEKESEEFHKNIILGFLNSTYYQGNYYINTKGRNDLVIHNGKDAKTTVGVIIETKKPVSKSEMLHKDDLNAKAFQELLLYYLRERITHGNLEIRCLIATNIYEWFIFDVDIFEKAFAQNKTLVKKFQDFEEKRLAGKKTDFFYKEIAEPAIKELASGNSNVGKNIFFTHFDIRDYESTLRNKDKADDNKLIPLFKLLSPEHLLKLPFKNDSNSLDKQFYSELLHVLGLNEIKEGGKKLIDRKEVDKRDAGSIIENTITQLHTLDKVYRLEKPSAFGRTDEERYFNVGLELIITWINRILFLKLLEAQLITYHKGDKTFSFLNKEKIKNFDDLNALFFQVLAKEAGQRAADINKVFGKVPYLNSSLFEHTDLEHTCLFISQLQPEKELPILTNTVLKDNNGKRRTGKINTLDYLFEFLGSYDFSSEGSEEIQEENKTLISASVLGLIFEKINGYKDGSFFTPGFITMYMCRETIRKSVVQKFNEVKGWSCQTIDELYDKIEDKKEANKIVNSLKICDPAVGSGHFLVSALNEIVAIKADLKILMDRHGKTLRDYHVEVSNDELIVIDENAILFKYNPKNKESQRIQETLFHEKQSLIENSLFGVDINTNSVKICRLRLWIELLKNAYYKENSDFTELETLPNIDINIKCGNSLVSRFPLDSDLSQALKKSKITIKKYKEAAQSYRHATSKEQKREMEQLIATIKGDFRTEISNNDKKVIRLNLRKGERDKLVNQRQLFELSKAETKVRNKKVEELTKEIEKLSTEIDEIKSNKIYENAFEWRFEFPETLDDDGNYQGFNVVLGNPPYGVDFSKQEKDFIKNKYKSYQYKFDSYVYFIEQGINILANNGYLEYITPILWLTLDNCYPIRSILLEGNDLQRIFVHGENIFEEAVVNTCSLSVHKSKPNDDLRLLNGDLNFVVKKENWITSKNLKIQTRLSPEKKIIIDKIESASTKLSAFGEVIQGITPYDSYSGQSKEIIDSRAYHFDHKKDATCGKWLEGKNLNRYSISWKDTWLSYGDWLAAPREKRFFEGARILFREVPGKGKRIQASIASDESYYGHSISPFKPHSEFIGKLEYFLGISNSKLISWYGRYTLPNFGKDIFPKVNPNDIKELPIANSFKFLHEISERVLLMLNIHDKTINKIKLDDEIDSLIYSLYGLTIGEVETVESDLRN